LTERKRVGVFGGTFDPIHIGHLASAEDAAHTLSLDRVLFVPNRQPPHKLDQQVADTAHRVAMVERAIEENPLFEMSPMELKRDGPSYSLDTLRELRTQLGKGTDLYFLIGCDALAEFHTWHEPQALLKEFQIVVMERPTEASVDWAALERHFPSIRQETTVIPVVQLQISSSDIRQRVKEGKPIRYYVPETVRLYIEDHSLYKP
jgi:nicotinate-nucleotide adenylyltransferase